jgi:hypothetical protein
MFAITEDGRRIWFAYGPNQRINTEPPSAEAAALAQEIAAKSGAELDVSGAEGGGCVASLRTT